MRPVSPESLALLQLLRSVKATPRDLVESGDRDDVRRMSQRLASLHRKGELARQPVLHPGRSGQVQRLTAEILAPAPTFGERATAAELVQRKR